MIDAQTSYYTKAAVRKLYVIMERIIHNYNETCFNAKGSV